MTAQVRHVVSWSLCIGLVGCGSCNDTASALPPDASTHSISTESIKVGERTRSFVLSVPTAYDKQKSYPLVYVMHPDGGNGAGLQKGLKFEDTSKDEAILVFPDGEYATWDLYGALATNKDVAFIDALTSSLASRFTVDKKRVFMWGFSNGAFFANQLACRKPGFLRAIAAQSGGAPYEPPENNTGKWPNGYPKCVPDEAAVSAIVFHGTADTTVTFDSGEFSAEYWRYVGQCKTTTTDVAPAPCKKFDGCTGETSVVFCAIPGAGHDVWQEAVSAGFRFFQTFR